MPSPELAPSAALGAGSVTVRRILQLSTRDVAGGAEAVAFNLHQRYRSQGLQAQLLVGSRVSLADGVAPILNANGQRGWQRWWWRLDDAQNKPDNPGRHTARSLARLLADPGRLAGWMSGHENFRFPGSWHLFDSPASQPDVLHAHNLHGGYFDLRALASLSRQVPTILTLHDTWLLSGHCAYSLGCERWKTGCGQCPDLTLYPPVRRDATAANWRRKQAIYRNSRLFVAAPCKWIGDRVNQSILAPAIAEARVIANGVDRTIFRPGEMAAARAALGLPVDVPVVLFVGNQAKQNPYKDYQTVREAASRLAAQSGRPLLFVALGGEDGSTQVGSAEFRTVAYQADPRIVACYYQAADVYSHAAHADTFPNAVLEALACGTPVVATAVGGIPEQVDDCETGFLTPMGDAAAMAVALRRLLDDDSLRRSFGWRAAARAARDFDMTRQMTDYLQFYSDAMTDHAERLQQAADD